MADLGAIGATFAPPAARALTSPPATSAVVLAAGPYARQIFTPVFPLTVRTGPSYRGNGLPSWPNQIQLFTTYAYRGYATTADLGTANCTGELTGTVRQNGVLIPYAQVFLYSRVTGALVRSAICDASGAFTFGGLDVTLTINNGFYAVAKDPDNQVTQWNAAIYDRLIPA